MKRAIVTVISGILFSLVIQANGGIGKHIVKWIQIDEGLSNNYIVSLDFDKYGAMWIGTEEGMNRFDGVSLKSFTKYAGSIPGNELNKVISDKNSDKIWIASQRDGFASFDYLSGETECYSNNDSTAFSIPSDEITYLEQDVNGDIWFSTYTKGIGKLDVETGEITLYNSENVEGMLNTTIRCFTIDQDNKVYIAYFGSGIAVLNTETMTASHCVHIEGDMTSLPSNEIGCIYKDKDYNIWVGTRSGVALYRKVTKDFTVFDKDNAGIPDGIIYSILVTSDNKLLASPSYNGVWEMDLNNASASPVFTLLPDTEEIRNVGAHAMIEDRFGNLWIGTYGNGLMFVSRNTMQFSKLSYPSILSEKSVSSIINMNNGQMMVSTDGGGVDILDRNLDNTGIVISSLQAKNIISAVCDNNGNYWIGSFYRGIVVIDSLYNFKTAINIREARAFYEQGDTMWIASGTAALYAVDKNNYSTITRFGTQYFPDPYLKSINADTQGRLWVGTFRSGLFVFDRQMNIMATYNTESGFPSNSINNINRDSNGNMWVSTGAGLVCFSASEELKILKIYNEGDGISSESIGASVEDLNHTIWFSTNRSICHIDSTGKNVMEYDYRSGIANGNYAFNAAAVRDDGLISFGSTEGVTCFFPDEVINHYSDLHIHYSEIQIFDAKDPIVGETKSIYLQNKKGIELKYYQNSFNILFATDDYGLADNIQYSYRVQGKNNNWYIAPQNNYISFHQLAPGKYTLQIRAGVVDTNWSEDVASLEIWIRPPFYATIAAYVFYILLALGLVFLFISQYTSRLERENELKIEKASIANIKEINEERLRFYTNITHELKTPLTLILGPTEDMINDESLSEGARKKISVVHKNASNLLDLINQLLNFRKTETNNVIFKPAYGNLSTFIEDVGTIFSESNSNKQVEIKTNIEREVMAIFDKEIMTTVLNNLISNAMKYTTAGTITLGLKSENKNGNRIALISVSDTGLGIDKDQYDKIFERFYQVPGKQQAQGTGIGLSVVKNLVDIHHGAINVQSEKGKGSCFTVKIPIEPLSNKKETKSMIDGEISVDSPRPIVVVAEDNEDIRDYIKISLSDTYDVYTAVDGLEAYSLADKYMPDIILSDIMMPVMDGITLCEKVKNDIKLSHIPVIFLTAKDTIEDKVEGYKAGADSYIPKPFTSDILNARIRNLIESRKKIAQQYVNSVQKYKQSEFTQQNVFSSYDNEFIKKITSYIEDNLSSEDLDIGTIADNMNMSTSSLYRKVKGLLGISAIEFIRKIKMKKAAEMLASGKFNVSETAWNVGINSMIYFRQCFKDEYGMSPSEFKKKYNQER